MKLKLIFLSVLAIVMTSCNNSTSNTPEEQSSEIEIKEIPKATLHAATVAEWKSATDENKLLTCLDFASKIKMNKGEKYDSDTEMLADASYLLTCINEAIKGDNVDNNKVSEVAALCLVLKEAQ